MSDRDSPNSHAESTSRAVQQSVRTIAELERDFLEHGRTPTERVGDLLGGFIGSLRFLALQVFLLGGWILVNLGLIPGITPFDKPPFSLLELVVTVESIFLLTFVLMRENRLRRQSEQRSHLELQINLLSDNKASEILRTLQRISDHLGLEEVASDEEVQKLSHKTHLETLERELDKHLPKK